jgi:hypothetical protein
MKFRRIVMKNSTKVGIIICLTILLALSFSVAFAGNEKTNTTKSVNMTKNMTNTTTNITMPQNITNVTNMTNVTTNKTNVTSSFENAKGRLR